MKAGNNKTFLYIGLGICVATAVGLGVGISINNSRKRKQFSELIAAIKNDDPLKEGAGATGTSSDIYDANIWNPRQYFKQTGISKATLDIKTATVYATQIYDAKGYTYDNEENVIAALRHARNRSDIAKIADAFQLKYKKPLDTYLASFMGNTNKAAQLLGAKNYNDEVQKLIQNLPK